MTEKNNRFGASTVKGSNSLIHYGRNVVKEILGVEICSVCVCAVNVVFITHGTRCLWRNVNYLNNLRIWSNFNQYKFSKMLLECKRRGWDQNAILKPCEENYPVSYVKDYKQRANNKIHQQRIWNVQLLHAKLVLISTQKILLNHV